MEELAQTAVAAVGDVATKVTEAVMSVATTTHQKLIPEADLQSATASEPPATDSGVNGIKPVRAPLSLEEKLARGIAPVKEEFLWTPDERDAWKKERAAHSAQSAEGPEDDAKVSGSKKSKRAMKKARAEAKKVSFCLKRLSTFCLRLSLLSNGSDMDLTRELFRYADMVVLLRDSASMQISQIMCGAFLALAEYLAVE